MAVPYSTVQMCVFTCPSGSNLLKQSIANHSYGNRDMCKQNPPSSSAVAHAPYRKSMYRAARSGSRCIASQFGEIKPTASGTC